MNEQPIIMIHHHGGINNLADAEHFAEKVKACLSGVTERDRLANVVRRVTGTGSNVEAASSTMSVSSDGENFTALQGTANEPGFGEKAQKAFYEAKAAVERAEVRGYRKLAEETHMRQIRMFRLLTESLAGLGVNPSEIKTPPAEVVDLGHGIVFPRFKPWVLVDGIRFTFAPGLEEDGGDELFIVYDSYPTNAEAGDYCLLYHVTCVEDVGAYIDETISGYNSPSFQHRFAGERGRLRNMPECVIWKAAEHS